MVYVYWSSLCENKGEGEVNCRHIRGGKIEEVRHTKKVFVYDTELNWADGKKKIVPNKVYFHWFHNTISVLSLLSQLTNLSFSGEASYL